MKIKFDIKTKDDNGSITINLDYLPVGIDLYLPTSKMNIRLENIEVINNE